MAEKEPVEVVKSDEARPVAASASLLRWRSILVSPFPFRAANSLIQSIEVPLLFLHNSPKELFLKLCFFWTFSVGRYYTLNYTWRKVALFYSHRWEIQAWRKLADEFVENERNIREKGNKSHLQSAK